MFDISKLDHLVEDKAIDAKIEKLRAARDATLAKIAKAARAIEQAENQINRIMRGHSKQERKARTRRLIQRGAIAETNTHKDIAGIQDWMNDSPQDSEPGMRKGSFRASLRVRCPQHEILLPNLTKLHNTEQAQTRTCLTRLLTTPRVREAMSKAQCHNKFVDYCILRLAV